MSMVGFNRKNVLDLEKNNKEEVAFNKMSTPFAYLYERGMVPLDLVLFEQRVEELNRIHPLPPKDNKTIDPETLKLPELMPYRNATPPYQKNRYKQDMRMKSLDKIIQYKKDHEKSSLFAKEQYGRPIKYYKEYFNGNSETALQRIKYDGEPQPPMGYGSFVNNQPNLYAKREFNSSQIRNLGLENSHQYKVMASQNENRVNYGIYDNDYPSIVHNIQKQYKNQKELITDTESNFFKQSKLHNQSLTPLAAKQYDPPPIKTAGPLENYSFKLMTPLLPVYVPMNEKLPNNYQVIMPAIPSPAQPLSHAPNFTLLPGQTVEVTPFKKAPLRPGKFTDIQQHNRFIEPTAERYSKEKRNEKMDENYIPDLLQRGDKAGYNMNPHTTAVQVNYQRSENNKLRELKEEEVKQQKLKEKQEKEENFYNVDNRFG